MLNKLWKWWIEGLTAPLPHKLRRWLRGQRTLIWAGDAVNGLEFVARRKDSWKTVWRDPEQRSMPANIRRRLRSADIVVRLPADDTLKRTVAVPPGSSASAYIAQHLEELSPFPEDQICFDAVTKPGGSSAVLVIARKADIENRLARLRECGLRARAVTVEEFEQTPLNLMPHGYQSPARHDPTGAIMLGAGLLACGAVVTIPFAEQSRALQELTGEASRLEQRLAAGDDARDRIHRLRARAATVSGRRASGPDPVTVLAEVTGAVPDHTWVRQLVLDDGTLTLHGESGDTADLITNLETAPRLRNVRYDTAITHDIDSGTNRFKLVAEINREGS